MNLPNVKVTEREVSTQVEAWNNNFTLFLKDIDVNKVAAFQEKPPGDWGQAFLKHLNKPNKLDCTDLFRQITLTKTSSEIQAMRISAKFSEYCTRQLIDHIEHLIDQDSMQTL